MVEKGVTSSVDVFRDLNEQLKDEINQYAQLIKFTKTDHSFSSEDTLKYFYIVISGRIKVFQMNLENAKEQTIYLLTRGDMFDTIALLDEHSHDVSYEVIDEGKALRLPIGKVRHWLNSNPTFNTIFFPYIAKQMRQVEELATDISLYDTSERLYKLILKNLNPYHTDKLGLIQNLSRTEIANLIGTVRHVVDRHINALKREGILDTKRKQMVVTDIDKLLKKLKLGKKQ
jgi:CRP/FNR family cyclic AMP-dependent transcriptional regulator